MLPCQQQRPNNQPESIPNEPLSPEQLAPGPLAPKLQPSDSTHLTWSSVLFVLTVTWLVALMILGTILPQNQPEAHYRAVVPGIAPLILACQLHDVYSSPLFLALLGLLAVQLFLRSILPLCRPRHNCSAPFWRYGTSLSYGGCSAITVAILLSQSVWSFSGTLYLSPNRSLSLPTTQVEDLAVTLERIDIDVDEERNPRAYTSHLIFSSAEETVRQTSSVNAPSSYNRIDFYQSGCGVDAVDIIATQNGRSTPVRVALSSSGNLPLFTIPNQPQYRYIVHRFYPHATWKNGTINAHDNLPGQAAASIMELRLSSIDSTEPRVSPAPSNPTATSMLSAPNETSTKSTPNEISTKSKSNETLAKFTPNANATSSSIQSWRNLGWLRPGTKVMTSGGCQLELGSLHAYSVIRYKRDVGYPCLLFGFALLLPGLILQGIYILKRQDSI